MQILEYLEAYTEHFGFREHIAFRTEVISILPSLKNVCTVSIKVRFMDSAAEERTAHTCEASAIVSSSSCWALSVRPLLLLLVVPAQCRG